METEHAGYHWISTATNEPLMPNPVFLQLQSSYSRDDL